MTRYLLLIVGVALLLAFVVRHGPMGALLIATEDSYSSIASCSGEAVSTRKGRRHYLPALVNGRRMNMLVDTGSDITLFDVRDFAKLEDARLAFDVTSQTANGIAYIARSRVHEIKIGGVTVRNPTVHVGRNVGESVIGMDIIGRLRLRIDGDRLSIECPKGAMKLTALAASETEEKPEKSKEPEAAEDDDIPQKPHPDWKKKTDDWERRGRPFEYPVAPAKSYPTRCRFYRSDGCGDDSLPHGGAGSKTCGIVADLANGKEIDRGECERRRAAYAKANHIPLQGSPDVTPEEHLRGRLIKYGPPVVIGCGRGGCPVDEEE